MEKKKHKTIKKQKDKYTLADFLPKDVIDDFIEYKDDPEAKKEYEDADAELVGILEDFEDYLGREMTKYEYKTVINIMKNMALKIKTVVFLFFFLPKLFGKYFV
jgi:hypothetical protein